MDTAMQSLLKRGFDSVTAEKISSQRPRFFAGCIKRRVEDARQALIEKNYVVARSEIDDTIVFLEQLIQTFPDGEKELHDGVEVK